MKAGKALLVIVLANASISLAARVASHDIRPGQVDYLPNSIKTAAAADNKSDSFRVMNRELTTTVSESRLLPPA